MAPELIYLEQIKYNLRYVDYNTINNAIHSLKTKFFPTALIFKGEFIERARINYSGEIFTKRSEIGYITDLETLANKVSYGRANLPHQSIFYGSIISPEIQMPRAVTYMETTSRIKELATPGPFREIFTVGRWRVLETFEIAEIIYSDLYNGKSEYARMAVENQQNTLEQAISELKKTHGKDYSAHFEHQAKLFCNEFAKNDVQEPDDYKISAAYANYIFENTHCKGLTYPSVPSGYQGQNVALLPDLVDSFLSLETVYLCS